MKIIEKDAILMGKTQYPSKLAAWKKDLNQYKATSMIPKSWH